MTTRLDFSIGPVQGFVVQSRRTRDLWGSSYLLSVLSAHAMRGAEQAGGRIVSPVVESDQLYRWVSGSREGDAPRIGSLPNHFVIETQRPAGVVARAAERRIEEAWQRVCDAVRARLVEGVASAGDGTGAIWKRQTANFWEVLWTAGTGADGGGLLARRKQWWTHRMPEEPGDKCTVMHDLQELSGYVRAESRAGRARQDEFWKRVRDQALVGELDLRQNERLCAVALVKRLFPLVSGAALGWKVDATRWPSTVHIGTRPWIERARATAPREAERYVAAVGEKEARTIPSRPPVAGAGSGTTGLARIDANWLHLDFVRDHRRCRPPATDDEGPSRADLIRLLKDMYEAADGSGRPLGRPSSFYALLKADGDRLGRLVSETGPEPVGKALARFTREVPDVVTRHGGVTVYAGGDDALAMLPVPGALSCAEALSNRYRFAFGDQADATLSAAVLFTHIRLPLRSALAKAGRLLDDVAKDGNGRDSLAAAVLKGGGMHCQWVTTWARHHSGRDSSAVGSLHRLARKLGANDGDPGLSSSLVYRIRETLSLLCERPRWEPGTWAALPGNLDAVAFLRAEILRSLGLRSTGEAEKQASEWSDLVRAVLPRARADRETAPAPVGVDGLLLARFLADPDGQEAGP